MNKNIELNDWKRKMCDESLELANGVTCVRKNHPEQIINISNACQGCPYE